MFSLLVAYYIYHKTQKFLQDIKLLLGALENAPTSKQIRTTYLDIDSPRNLPDYLSEFQLNKSNVIVVASKDGGQKTLFKYEARSLLIIK